MISVSSFCVLIFSLHFQGLESLQRFDKQPQYSEVNPGEDIRLDCQIFNKRGTCAWQKDNKLVGIYVKKYEWAGNQEAGDCSLWIRASTLEFDDGEWSCQVTASDFTTQDALTSRPVRLVVRVTPQKPRVEFKTSHVLPGHNLTIRANERSTVKCLSRYGNPPARLKWFLGDVDISLKSNQTNNPETDNMRTWVASSVLEIMLDKSQHAQSLRCVALHESYPAKSQSTEVRLDVTYPPETRLLGTPGSDIEEGVDTVVLRCVTDANPPAAIVWRRAGKSDISSLEESLQFRPVTRRDSGTYTCEARNSVGVSEPLTVQLDVKFGPVIKTVGPDRLTTATLFSPVSFICEAESHPKPSYHWLQKLSPSPDSDAVIRGSDSKLIIRNVTYDHQGEYVCRVSNLIGGNERVVQSEAISLQVVGPPQVLREGGNDATVEVVTTRGLDAVLRMTVCADPRPRTASWEWGSLRLQTGSGQGRYRAEELIQTAREDCFEAKLHVGDVELEDSRSYFLVVENERGVDRHAVRLAVRGSYTEPVPMMVLASLAAGCLVVFIFCVLFAVYCVRTEKCCFARRGDFRPTDLESEKSDMNSTLSRKTPRIDASVLHGPGEAMYCSTPTRRPPHTIMAGGSPEAMKNFHLHFNSTAQRQHSGSGRSSSKKKRERKLKETNLFSDLQTPSVSNNGATMTTLPSRMTFYNKAFPTEDFTTASYFCPKPEHLHFDNKYDLSRPYSRNGYDFNSVSERSNYDNSPVTQRKYDVYFSRTIPNRHSHNYQPRSYEKAEI